MSNKYTTIRIKRVDHQLLSDIKNHPRETCEEVFSRVLAQYVSNNMILEAENN